MPRLVRILTSVALGLTTAAVVLAGLALADGRDTSAWHGVRVEPPEPASDFTLLSDAGPVSLSDSAGGWRIVFFGFTSCPDVCPATMARLASALEDLGPRADRFQVMLVSVDPERDSPERVGRWARQFHPDFLGLTGTRSEIEAVAVEWGIYHGRVPPVAGAARSEPAQARSAGAGGEVLVHAANVTVVDPDGRIRLVWPWHVAAEAMAEDLERLLEE